MGDYEKELKMLKVKLDAANNELERNDPLIAKIRFQFSLSLLFSIVKQTLIQSSADNVNELNLNGQKAIEDLEKIKQVEIILKLRLFFHR